jgi:hypothetical protein
MCPERRTRYDIKTNTCPNCPVNDLQNPLDSHKCIAEADCSIDKHNFLNINTNICESCGDGKVQKPGDDEQCVD